MAMNGMKLEWMKDRDGMLRRGVGIGLMVLAAAAAARLGGATGTGGDKLTAEVLVERQGGDLRVTDEFGTRALGLSDLRVALKLLPLLSKEVVVDTVEIKNLRAHFVRAKNGHTNLDDLSGAGEKPAATPAEKGAAPPVRGSAAPV